MSSKKSNQPERRKFPRAKFNEDVTIHKVTESKSGNVFEVEGQSINAKAKDVSEGGMKLELGKGGSAGNILKLNFQIQKNQPFDVYTKIAWEADGYCGLQFIVVDEEIRRQIKAYVDKVS
ncbi:MAG TPA: PilZ domain-containing protein [bacterium]|nr:PilZ domain-containing protein [bacterium]